MVKMVTTIVVFFIGHIFLNILEGYEPCLAFLCCILGAKVEALALPRSTMDQDTVVALFHLVRAVFVFMPHLLALLEGDVPLEASNIALRQGPAFLSLMLKNAAFVAIAFGGFLFARWCRVLMLRLLVCSHFLT